MRVDQHPGRTAPEIVSWRRRQLLAAGFDSSLASRLARDGAYDLHALIELVGRGCRISVETSSTRSLSKPQTTR